MSNLLGGLLGALIATNQASAVSNLVEQSTGMSVTIPDPNDPRRIELKKLEDADDAAQAEVDEWIRQNSEFAAKGAGIPKAELNQRIRKRFETVQKSYEEFIKREPNFAPARIAYASFLGDIGDEDAEVEQLEKARELDPKDPAIWNNLANYHGHRGPVKTAFAYYEKAIQLDPKESVYYQNFATTVYLFRKDAREYYNISEQQVFDKALKLYEKAFALDPTNFPLATDLAQSYYGIKPVRTDDALKAWTNALNIAHDDVEREGVYVHLARFEMVAGRFDDARAHLTMVTNPMYADLKHRLGQNIELKEKGSTETNAPPTEAGPTNSPAAGN